MKQESGAVVTKFMPLSSSQVRRTMQGVELLFSRSPGDLCVAESASQSSACHSMGSPDGGRPSPPSLGSPTPFPKPVFPADSPQPLGHLPALPRRQVLERLGLCPGTSLLLSTSNPGHLIHANDLQKHPYTDYSQVCIFILECSPSL